MNKYFVITKHVFYSLSAICRLSLPGKLIVCFMLVSLSGKPSGKTTTFFPGTRDFMQLTAFVTNSDMNVNENTDGGLNPNIDSLSWYAFVANKLNEKDKYIEKQKALIARQKSRLSVLFFLFIMIVIFLLFSIFFFRYQLVKLNVLYKKHNQLSVSKGLTYYQKNDKQLVLTGEQEKFRRIYNGVLRLFDKEKIYLDPGLTIRDIAQQLYTNEKYVSKAINLCAEMNFSNFLNKYRVNEAINYMRTPLYDPLSLEQIMEKSGFYSRSTFISAFKNRTGMSPGQCRNQFSEAKVIEMPASAG